MNRAVRVLALACALALPSLPAAAQGTGLVFLEPDRYRSIPLAPPTGLTSIPAEMDLSKDFPTPGDQGSQGSCVGWAVGYALKSYQERRERLWTNWDDTKRMSPAFVYNQIKVGGCDDGARIADALDLVTSTGAAAWADQPYSPTSCNDLPTALTKQNASVNRVAAWFRVNPQDRQAIKTSVAAGIPVVVGMRVDDRFKALKAGETWRGGGVPAEAHATVVVGYSDSRDAVKVINSWGTDWGDGGFGWIDFETFRAVTREAYVAQDIVLPVGMAERKEHPYTVKTGPFGPEAFGLKLGMTRAQITNSTSRVGQWSSRKHSDGFNRDVLTISAKDLGIAAEFHINTRFDFLERINIQSQKVVQDDSLLVFSDALESFAPREKIASLLKSGKFYKDFDMSGFSPRACEAVVDAIVQRYQRRPLELFQDLLRAVGIEDFNANSAFVPPPKCYIPAYSNSGEPMLTLAFDKDEVGVGIRESKLGWFVHVSSSVDFGSKKYDRTEFDGRLVGPNGENCAVAAGSFYAFRSDDTPLFGRADKSKPLANCRFEFTEGLLSSPSVIVTAKFEADVVAEMEKVNSVLR